MFKVQSSRFKVQGSRYLVCAVAVIILCLYSVKTISRNRVWKDNFTLFTTDVKTSKNSAKGNFEAGLSYIKKAMYTDDKNNIPLYCFEAEKHLKTALILHPNYIDAMVLIADLHAMFSGNLAESLHYYAMALQCESTLYNKTDKITREILNMTNKLLDDNQIISTPEEILRSCDLLLKVKPDLGEALFVKGVIYGKYLNNLEMALSSLEQALAMDFPKTVRFYEYIGAAYGFSGDYPHAIQYLLKAVELESDDYNTYINLGVLYQRIDDMENANFYASKGNAMKENVDK
jgi:tetratricopeptide (TPR) repeat protein